MSHRFAPCAAIVCLFVLIPDRAAAQTSWQFTRIANTATPAPGSAGNFTAFSLEVAIRNGNVAFQGGAGSTTGIYTAAVGSAPTLVANTATTAPGIESPGLYSSFEAPSVDAAGNVAFVATTATNRQGVYTRVGGTLGVVADTTTPTPSAATTFNAFTFSGGAAIDAGSVAFTAFSRNASATVFQEGAYTNATGPLTRVADRSNLIPGSTTNFVFFERANLRNGTVVYTGGNGSGGRNGVYTVPTTGGALNTVADQTTPLPGGGTYALEGSTFRGPSIDNGQVATFSFNNQGFYRGTTTGSPLTVLANNTTVPFGSAQPFISFDMLSLSNGRSALLASNGGNFNIWSDFGGSVYELVIGPGMQLDGKTLSEVRFGRWGFDGNQIAFRAVFTDGSSGVYVATAPVPEPAGVLAVAAAAAAVWRRTRRVGRLPETVGV